MCVIHHVLELQIIHVCIKILLQIINYIYCFYRRDTQCDIVRRREFLCKDMEKDGLTRSSCSAEWSSTFRLSPSIVHVVLWLAWYSVVLSLVGEGVGFGEMHRNCADKFCQGCTLCSPVYTVDLKKCVYYSPYYKFKYL